MRKKWKIDYEDAIDHNGKVTWRSGFVEEPDQDKIRFDGEAIEHMENENNCTLGECTTKYKRGKYREEFDIMVGSSKVGEGFVDSVFIFRVNVFNNGSLGNYVVRPIPPFNGDGI